VAILVGLYVYDDSQFVVLNIHTTHNMHGIDYFYASLNPKPLILGMSSWALPMTKHEVNVIISQDLHNRS
jgi:hypothetical protein